MKLNKPIIFLLYLISSASIAQATPPYARASISATATVIPSLGLMPTIDHSQTLFITESTDSKLLIQAPKNSTLIIHIQNANQTLKHSIIPISLSTKKDSVSDIYTVDVSDNQSSQIITIITTDN